MSRIRGIRDFNNSKNDKKWLTVCTNDDNEDDCTCPETPVSSKNVDKLSQMSQKKFRDKKNYDCKKINRAQSSSCEKAWIDKSYTKRDTVTSPDVVKVTSVEVIKSWSRDCCSRRKDNDKNGRDLSSNKSSSSADSLPRNPSRTPKNPKTHQLLASLRRPRNHSACICCSCMEKRRLSRLKHIELSKRLERSPIYHQKKTNPQASQTHPRKLCRMLKTREAKRIIGCTCINDELNCPNDCKCPEASIELDQNFQSNAKKFQSRNPTNHVNITGEVSPSGSCGCDDVKAEKYSQSPIKLHELHPEVPPPNNWKQCGDYLRKFTDEYTKLSSHLKEIRREIDNINKPDETVRKKITRKYPGKEFSFELKTIGKNRSIINDKNSGKHETVDRSCQWSESSSWKNFGDDIQVSGGIGDNCECKRDVREGKFEESGGRLRQRRARIQRTVEDFNCNISDCDCGSVDEIDGEKMRDGVKKKMGGRVRRHDFSLPRIVQLERSRGERRDDKMLIYPPKNQTGCPLTLYKSESYVDCCVKEVNDVGFKYDVSYVQRYASLPWKPGELTDNEGNSEELSTDEYG